MARISIMEALSRVLTASKDYTDEKNNSKQSIIDNTLETESKTVVGAINELKNEHIYKAPDTIYEYTFDPDKRTEYEEVTGSTVSGDFKIAELEDLPPMEILTQCECVLTCYSTEFGTASGTATLVSLNDKQTGYSIYFENDDPVQSGSAYILYKQWTPGPGYTYSPGVWIRCSDSNGSISYQQNIKFVLPNEDTKESTLVEAIHEDKEDIKDIKEEITIAGTTYSFDIDNADSYESFGTGYGFTYYKIMELEDMPTDLNEMPESPYTLTMYDSSQGGIIETPAIFETHTDHFGYTQHYISTEDYKYYQIIILLYESWIPNAGVEFSPGVWVRHSVEDDGTIVYPISVTMGEKTIKKELENKADLVDEHELINMLEEELNISVEE